MADEFSSSTNWWDRSRLDARVRGSSSSSTTSSSLHWPTEMGAVKGRSSMDSVSVSDSSGVDLHMVGLGLSSQAMDWNQSLIRGEEGEHSFRSMLQENLNSSSNYQQEAGIGSSQVQWREQINRGFSLHQPQTSFQTDTSATAAAAYGSPSPVFQGLLGTENHHYGGSYGLGTGDQLMPSWSNKVPQFFRNSPPKQASHCQLQFSNNAPFWSASASTTTDVRPAGFSPSLQLQFPTSNFEEKPKNISEVRDSSAVAKKSTGGETSTKRPRNEATSPLPAFKVRKEKMGDRITALQQLVSPFGKTDTASVLSEAIDYIKIHHEQVIVLSTPYMKSGAPVHHNQSSDKPKEPEGQNQDLRSRGLCLVPVSSTFPATQEPVGDFWNPTFGGTFR